MARAPPGPPGPERQRSGWTGLGLGAIFRRSEVASQAWRLRFTLVNVRPPLPAEPRIGDAPRRVLLEDYGLIGDMQAAALVGRDGGVDWLCLPRFDSPSCFSALLGDERHGRWLVAPAGEVRETSRRYRPGTLVLETEFETADGVVRLIDFMP